jgi:hypothetical protein
MVGRPELSEHLMQIFIDDLEEFDANMDKQGFAMIWRSCHTATHLDFLLRRFSGFVRSMPTSERFRFIANIISSRDSPVLTLKKIELCGGITSPSDIVLGEFYTLHGSEVLHHVAEALVYDDTSAHLDFWTRIGLNAIQNGADTVHVVGKRTPLLQSLVKGPPLGLEHMFPMESISRRLQPWMHCAHVGKCQC